MPKIGRDKGTHRISILDLSDNKSVNSTWNWSGDKGVSKEEIMEFMLKELEKFEKQN